jgi:hypothetical protein
MSQSSTELMPITLLVKSLFSTMKYPYRSIAWVAGFTLGFFATLSGFAQTGVNVVPELKGCKLGITLGEFHDKMFGADSDYWGTDRHALGWYMFVAPEAEMIAPRSVAGATLGGGPAMISFRFQKADDKKKSVLYYIDATFVSSAAEVILQGLTEKFGEPIDKRAIEKANTLGAKIAGFRAVWALSDQKYAIRLDSIGDRSDHGSLVILDIKLSSEVQKKAAARGASDL